MILEKNLMKNKDFSFKTFEDLSIVILSEVSKEKYCRATVLRGNSKEMIYTNLQNRKRLIDLENKLMVAEGKG